MYLFLDTDSDENDREPSKKPRIHSPNRQMETFDGIYIEDDNDIIIDDDIVVNYELYESEAEFEFDEDEDEFEFDEDQRVHHIAHIHHLVTSFQNITHTVPKRSRTHKRRGNSNCTGTFFDMDVSSITQRGLEATVNFRCRKCQGYAHVPLVRPNVKPSLNESAVLGVMAIGQGCYAQQRLFSTMHVQPISSNKYYSIEKELHVKIEDTLEKVLDEAVEAEKSASVEEENGYTYIDASSDGAWFTKPSKEGGYKSIGGFATIVGEQSKQIIAVDVMNLYCRICSNHIGEGPLPQHECVKNFDQSPGQMEPIIVAQEVTKLAQEKKAVIRILTQDGDASTMKALNDKRPYAGLAISLRMPIKCRCFLHACRCCIGAVRRLAATNAHTKRLFAGVVTRLVKNIRCIIKKFHELWLVGNDSRKAALVSEMTNEILNLASHCIEDHTSCGDWCEKKGQVQNKIALDDWMLEKFRRAIGNLAAEAKSLIMKRSTNSNECANAG